MRTQGELRSNAEFGNCLYRAIVATKRELQQRNANIAGDGEPHELEFFIEYLEKLLEDFRNDTLPPKDQRGWPLTRMITDTWAWENPLGLLIAGVENYFCKRL